MGKVYRLTGELISDDKSRPSSSRRASKKIPHLNLVQRASEKTPDELEADAIREGLVLYQLKEDFVQPLSTVLPDEVSAAERNLREAMDRLDPATRDRAWSKLSELTIELKKEEK